MSDTAITPEFDHEALRREVASRSVAQQVRRFGDLRRMLGENRCMVRAKNLAEYEAELPLCVDAVISAVVGEVERGTGLTFIHEERCFIDRETGDVVDSADALALWRMAA